MAANSDLVRAGREAGDCAVEGVATPPVSWPLMPARAFMVIEDTDLRRQGLGAESLSSALGVSKTAGSPFALSPGIPFQSTG